MLMKIRTAFHVGLLRGSLPHLSEYWYYVPDKGALSDDLH